MGFSWTESQISCRMHHLLVDLNQSSTRSYYLTDYEPVIFLFQLIEKSKSDVTNPRPPVTNEARMHCDEKDSFYEEVPPWAAMCGFLFNYVFVLNPRKCSALLVITTCPPATTSHTSNFSFTRILWARQTQSTGKKMHYFQIYPNKNLKNLLWSSIQPNQKFACFKLLHSFLCDCLFFTDVF